MNNAWFLLALIGPFLYAMTNHIDKLLLEKYFKQGGVGTLILFSSLLSIFALPLILLVDSSVLSVSGENVAALGAVAILNIALLWFYLLALKEEEASIVIVFYQLVPVLGLVFGFFILDEFISMRQFVAMSVIILGTSIISFKHEGDNGFGFRKKTVYYMVGACTCWALQSVIFKGVALEENVWRSLFWEHSILLIVGVMIFIFIPSYRQSFVLAFKQNSTMIISLNGVNEALYMLGNAVIAFAFMRAPVALVLLTQTFQPIFVFIVGVVLTVFFPNIGREDLEIKNMIQKLVAICITGLGTYILLSP